MFHLPLLYQPGLLVNFLFLVKKSYAAYVHWSELPMFAGAFSGLILNDFSKLEMFWIFLGLLQKRNIWVLGMFKPWHTHTHTPRVWWWTSHFLDGFWRANMNMHVVMGFGRFWMGFSLKHPQHPTILDEDRVAWRGGLWGLHRLCFLFQGDIRTLHWQNCEDGSIRMGQLWHQVDIVAVD